MAEDRAALFRERLDKEQLIEMYLRLEQQLMNPPEPWVTFGTHSIDGAEVKFWGTGEDGMPIWERPLQD